MNGVSARCSTGDPNAPRIVAATVKSKPKRVNDLADGNARIAGDLRVVERFYRQLRYAEVRSGSLLLYRYAGRNKVLDCRIPLYNLNINLDSPKHFSQFSLSKYGEITPMKTFQVVEQQDYKKWLKALVVEIIRQTPLNTLKFLDVLFISELLDKQKSRKCDKFNSLSSKPSASKPLTEISSLDATKTGRPTASRNKITSLIRKYQACDCDVNHNKPIDFIEPDYLDAEDTRVRSFDLSAPVTVNLKSDMIRSSDSDSGFCSLQSTQSDELTKHNSVESPSATTKSKIKLRRTDSFRMNVSTSCMNLLSKFKRMGVRENSGSSHKCDRCDSPAKLPDSNTSEEKKKNTSRLWEFRNWSNRVSELEQVRKGLDSKEEASPRELESAPPKRHPCRRFRISSFLHESKYSCAYVTNNSSAENASPVPCMEETEVPQMDCQICDTDLKTACETTSIPDVLRDLPETRPKRKPCVNFQLPEELLQNENANKLVRLLTKCQIDKEFVPVREKRLMFESLSRFSFSTDNLRKRKILKLSDESELTRFSSLQTLHKSPVPVRVMKKYFESFGDKGCTNSWNKNPVSEWISANSVKYS